MVAYEEWLRDRGIWWDPRLRLRPPRAGCAGIDAGWGLWCTEAIPQGAVVIKVPRAAALTAAAPYERGPPARPRGQDDAPAEASATTVSSFLAASGVPAHLIAFDPDVDRQLPLALAYLLLRETAGWAAKLRAEVTPRVCPLAWTEGALCREDDLRSASVPRALCGTELEAPVAAKRRRLGKEFDALPDDIQRAIGGLVGYANACAVVMSRVQPWFGGSFVPIVTQANHAWGLPHVEFRRRPPSRGGAPARVEGRALRAIPPGEVFQSYGELSTADALYRYGFVPAVSSAAEIVTLPGDCVTVTGDLLLSAAAAVTSRHAGCTREAPAASRCAILDEACLLGESPWDGVDGVLGVELGAGGQGIPELVAAAALVLLPEGRWSAAVERGQASELREYAVAEALHAELFGGSSAWPPQPACGGPKRPKAADSEFPWSKRLPAGSLDWAPREALLVAKRALLMRDSRYSSQYRTTLQEDCDAFDSLVSGSSDGSVQPPLAAGVLRLRIMERRLLSAASQKLEEVAGVEGASEL